ncbi:MAG: hypothetical protein ACYC35_22740 [Pirellulales bacterium]
MRTLIVTTLLLVIANVCIAQTAQQVKAAKSLATINEVEATYTRLNRVQADDLPPQARAAYAKLVNKAQKVRDLYKAAQPHLENVIVGDESRETGAIVEMYMKQVPVAQREMDEAFEEFNRAAGLR